MHCNHTGVATQHASHTGATTPRAHDGADHAFGIDHATGTHPKTGINAAISRRPNTITLPVATHGLTLMCGSCCHTHNNKAAKTTDHNTERLHCTRGTTDALHAGDCVSATNVCTDKASSPSRTCRRRAHTRFIISVYAVINDHISTAVTYARGHAAGDHDVKINAASINVKHGSTT